LLPEGLAASRVGFRALAVLLACAVVAAASGSYVASARARVWWIQDDGAAAENFAVSEKLNKLSRPLLISTSGGTLLEMSHYLRPETRIRVVLDGRVPPLGRGFSDILIYGSPANGAAAARLAALLRDVRRHHNAQLQPVSLELPCCGLGIRPIPGQFWRLVPTS
jgi:hypothetical protein